MFGRLKNKLKSTFKRTPGRHGNSYDYQLKNPQLTFEEGVAILKNKLSNRVHTRSIDNVSSESVCQVCARLKELGVQVDRFKVEKNEYEKYVNRAHYKKKYPNYYRTNFYEKTLEHYLCYTLLDLNDEKIFIDIASEHSPVWKIFTELSGCVSYSQDIMYEPGIHARQIGSNASQIPVADEFFDAAIATCSIEHFENKSDVEFMQEMERVLKKRGTVVIVPLYLHGKASCQTDPKYAVAGEVSFDEGAEIYCAKDWGNRHGRFYSPETLCERLINVNKNLDFKVLFLDNAEEIDFSIYCRYILTATKK